MKASREIQKGQETMILGHHAYCAKLIASQTVSVDPWLDDAMDCDCGMEAARAAQHAGNCGGASECVICAQAEEEPRDVISAGRAWLDAADALRDHEESGPPDSDAERPLPKGYAAQERATWDRLHAAECKARQRFSYILGQAEDANPSHFAEVEVGHSGDGVIRPMWPIPINGKVTAILVNPAPYAYLVNLAGFPSDSDGSRTVTWRGHNGQGGTLTRNQSLNLDRVKAIDVAWTGGA